MRKMSCSDCGHIQPVNINTVKTVMGIEHHYIQCERCYVKTTSFVTDKKLRRLIEFNAELREADGIPTDDELQQWEDNNEIIKIRMEELKDKHKF